MTFGFGKNDVEHSATAGGLNLASGFKMTTEKEAGSKEVYIGCGTSLEGPLKLAGPAYINCKLKGNITASETLTIGPNAEIDGQIEGSEVIVCGKVTGDINSNKSILLKQPAKVQGNLKAPKVGIDDGVVFNGQCSMKSPGEIVDLKREANS